MLYTVLCIIEFTMAAMYGWSIPQIYPTFQAHEVTSISIINQRLLTISEATTLGTVFTIIMLLELEVSIATGLRIIGNV